MIDGGRERRKLGVIGIELDAPLQRSADRNALHLPREFLQAAALASQHPEQRQQQQRDDPECQI